MNYLTNLVQFPGLGLSFQLNRVAFTIGGVSIYWYGVCIAVGLCLALVFAFRHSLEFGVDPDSMVDVILIGVVLGIISARAYYVAMAPFKYESIWEMIAIRDGGLAIYGGIIRGFLYESIWCFVGFFLLFRYIKKRKFNGDITLRYLVWYGAGRFWIEGLRTDSLMLVPSIGLRASQLVAGVAVVAGIAAEVYFTRKFKGKPLLVPLALNAENKAAQKKLDGPISFAGKDTQLLASSPRKLFLEKTEAYNAQVKAAIEQAGQKKA